MYPEFESNSPEKISPLQSWHLFTQLISNFFQGRKRPSEASATNLSTPVRISEFVTFIPDSTIISESDLSPVEDLNASDQLDFPFRWKSHKGLRNLHRRQHERQEIKNINKKLAAFIRQQTGKKQR